MGSGSAARPGAQVPGHICSPKCADGKTCPPMPETAGVTATPFCDYCLTGAEAWDYGGAEAAAAAGGAAEWLEGGRGAEKPTQCALICTATTEKAGPYKQDGCPDGITPPRPSGPRTLRFRVQTS